MLKRPSSRRRSQSEDIVLNLVPMMDALVTLISFLLFSMSFLAIVSIQSPIPLTETTTSQDPPPKEKPLQLTVTVRERETQIWSPFERFPKKNIPHRSDLRPDTLAIHQELLAIKTRFPTETYAVLAPSGHISYDQLIELMDAIRLIEKTDAPIVAANPQTGVEETAHVLFPNVVFGNLLGDLR